MQLFIHVENNIPLEWKLLDKTVQDRLPEGADPSLFGYLPFNLSPWPERNVDTQDVVEVTPILINNEWTQQWEVIDLELSIIISKQQAQLEQFQNECIARVQARLDSFANSHRYDSILSACSYVSSSIPVFAAEGKHCINVRDATWATMYSLMAEVLNGTRPPPKTFEEVEALLPTLVWT